ncbi:DHHC palmitoyltransferase-domain-containing protein [Paraphysoderma sedebokerense]|nr:DHHC palmitoyltransferase-domain-containing protein [Paraphysoderma sedebokerense]
MSSSSMSEHPCTFSSKRIIRLVGFIPVLFLVALIGWSYYAYLFHFAPNLPIATRIILLSLYHPIFLLFIFSYWRVVFTHPGSPKLDYNYPINPTNLQSDNHHECSDDNTALNSDFQVHSHSPSRSLLAKAPLSSSPPSNSRSPLVYPNDLTEPEPPATISVDMGEPKNNSSQSPIIITQQLHVEMYRDEKGVVWHNDSVQMKYNGGRRVCRKCDETPKPDRAHHCRICKECVLKMDHHCPWINNCVGFYNYKYFYLFLCYGTLYTVFIFVTVIPTVIRAFSSDSVVENLSIHHIFLVLCGLLFGISLLAFSIFHTTLILKNRTTIENLEKTHYKIGTSTTSTKVLNLFDLGKKRNWEQVMGVHKKYWWLPVKSSIGDGHVFPLNAYAYGTLAEDEV